jgi:4'-phosphopantetheinyl transferase
VGRVTISYLQTWPVPNTLPCRRPGEMHVWIAALDVALPTLRKLEGLLSADERARAARFVLSDARRQFVAARGQLRQLLGLYLGWPPQRLRIRYGPHGKPHLANVPEGEGMPHFNITHCGDFALCALSFDREVGVDLERIDESLDIGALGQHFLTPHEQGALTALTPRQHRLAYFRHWARKEAYVKARGCGLHMDPRTFSVLVNTDQCVHLTDTATAGEPPTVWTIRDLNVGLPYVAAIAAPGADWQPLCWSYAMREDAAMSY